LFGLKTHSRNKNSSQLKNKTDHNFTAETPLELQTLLFLSFTHTFKQPAFCSKSICLHKRNIFHEANINKLNIKVTYISIFSVINIPKLSIMCQTTLGSLPGIFLSSSCEFPFMLVFKDAASFSPVELQPVSHRTFSTKSECVLMVKCYFLKISLQGT
jgi:hypothetical protein